MNRDPAFVARQDQIEAGLRRRLTADGVNLEDILQTRAINIAIQRIASAVTSVLDEFRDDPDAYRKALYSLTYILDAFNTVTTHEAPQ